MYREEYTRRWHEDQFPGDPSRRPQQQDRYSSSWRGQYAGNKPQYDGQRPGNANYLPNGIPLPIRRDSGLYGPSVTRNPLWNDNVETSFTNNGYSRRSVAASDSAGYYNRGYARDDGRKENEKEISPYYNTSSAIGEPRNDSVYIYKGKTPSEPGFGHSNFSNGPMNKRQKGGDQSYVSGDDYSTAPSWIKVLDQPVYTDPDKSKLGSMTSKHFSKSKESIGSFIAFRLFIILLIIWDLINDWLLASSGPIQFLGTSGGYDDTTCTENTKVLLDLFKMNNSNIDTSMCKNINDVWTLSAVFSLLGSLLAILQVINIVLEIVKKRRPQFFQILQGQSEICFVLFFEELPQCILFTTYLFVCDCNAIKHVYLYSLLASISSTTAMTFRYASSFESVANENGCCNLWWRCCCCRDTEYCCRLHGKQCCCMCDMPCPLCCCTLQCNMCRYTPKTWCGTLLKAFSCFCSCCGTEDDSYGVRLMNNLSIFILWVCLAFQITIFYAMQ